MPKAWRDLVALQRPLLDHFQRQKWYYIFGAFIWTFVWWGMMNLMKHFQAESPFPLDVMPLIAGLPIIIVGWQAVALSGKLEHAMGDFDDGAAFVFPAGKAGTFRAFLADFRHSMTWWSRVISLAIVVVSLVGVLLLTSFADADWIHRLLGFALIIGVPLIALPIGSLLGLLMGFGQFTRIMDRHQIKFAVLSTPQARKAVRVLERVRIFAAMAPLIMCFWFAGWWIVWALGYSVEYREMWRTQFVVLWIVSIALFIFVGLFPARNFRRRMAELSGGMEGQRARDEQIRLARSDLEHWQQPAAERSRHQRQRIRELKLFIANLEDQRIESRFLDIRLLTAVLALNLIIFIVPIAVSVLAAPSNPVFQAN
ncbi:hypothetical protein LJR245_007518 [Rhizobium leguminosarum]|uniref:hypothetical protein n=1 Tax=Rhizobium leguminosarum TaxID=384 RepID=UPI003ED019C4